MKNLNKKGFTLIELLAVIAILAILIVIAVPGILTMYNSGKKSTFESQAKSIWKSVETAIINDTIQTGSPKSMYCFAGENDIVNELELSNRNIYYKATVNEDGEVANLQVQQVNNDGSLVFSTPVTATAQSDLTPLTDLTGIAKIKCNASN